MSDDSALVLFSGGQDSATCFAWALDRFSSVETIGFEYGQKHSVELECRRAVRKEFKSTYPQWKERIADDHVVDFGVLKSLGETALTHDVEIQISGQGLPNTFVPGRNLLFLTMAGAIAYRRGTRHLVAGVCETDFSGYPDCRDDTMKAVQLALNLGMGSRFVIHTPLMWLDKAQTWALARILGGVQLIELIVEHTHTCYHGDRSHRHDWGYGCGSCPACELRAGGYRRYVDGQFPSPPHTR